MITQADSRKWMACLYNSFLFMEAKIMKMAKKLLAVVLTGVMAVSMLTGCALGDAAKAKALENALNKADAQSGTQVVSYDHDGDLDSKAAKVYKDKFNSTKATAYAAVEQTPDLTAAKVITDGSKTYAYTVIAAPSDSADLKKAAQWAASGLHTALYDNVKAKNHVGTKLTISGTEYLVKNFASDTADKAKVKFGVKIYDNGQTGTNKKYCAIVVVELKTAA